MKITEVRAHPLSVPYAQPRWTAHERMERDQVVLVEVRTDQGVVGFGEIAGGPQKLICDLVDTFAGVIAGMDPLGHAEIWQKLFSLTSPRPGGIGGWDGMPAPLPRIQRPQIMAAIGGIDIALWDMKGKAVGLPVFRLLGGTRTEIFTYSTGGYYREGEPLERCADEFARFVADGYRAVKLKTGALSLADEVTRIRIVREAIGPGVKLMLDMNAPYDVAGCIRFAEAVAPYDILWLEEPLHWYLQPADYVRLAAASPIPLAHGEREWHRYTVRDFIDSGAIRFVQFDFDACGRLHRVAADRALRRAAGRGDRAAFGAACSRASRLGVRRRCVRRRGSWRSEPASDPPRHSSRRRACEGRDGASDGSARLRNGDRLGGCREVPIRRLIPTTGPCCRYHSACCWSLACSVAGLPWRTYALVPGLCRTGGSADCTPFLALPDLPCCCCRCADPRVAKQWESPGSVGSPRSCFRSH